MFRIRRIYDNIIPINKAAIAQVQAMLRGRFSWIDEGDIAGLPEKLRNPFKLPRRPASIAGGILIALMGLLPAASLSFLSVVDRLAEAMLALGAFFMAIFVGWVAVGASEELKKGASARSRKFIPAIMAAVRFVLPPVILFATVYAFIAVWRTYLTEFGG